MPASFPDLAQLSVTCSMVVRVRGEPGNEATAMPLVLFGGENIKTEGAYVAVGSAFSSGLVPRPFLLQILWYQYDK